MNIGVDVREIRILQDEDDANACLSDGWVLLSVQPRVSTDRQGADYHICYVVGRTDASVDPFAELARKEREDRILVQAARIIATRGLAAAEAAS